MTRMFRYVDQDGTHYKTETEILKTHWPVWKKSVLESNLKRDPSSQIPVDDEFCLADWIIVNWAVEVSAAEASLLSSFDFES